MTGRHEFVPALKASHTDGEEVSSYDYADQFKQHHDESLAGWDKKPGIHKRERQPLPAVTTLRKSAAAALTSLSQPRLGH